MTAHMADRILLIVALVCSDPLRRPLEPSRSGRWCIVLLGSSGDCRLDLVAIGYRAGYDCRRYRLATLWVVWRFALLPPNLWDQEIVSFLPQPTPARSGALTSEFWLLTPCFPYKLPSFFSPKFCQIIFCRKFVHSCPLVSLPVHSCPIRNPNTASR